MENVSFSLDDGYLMTLLGRNGAGKTTLFDLVYGHIEPLSGKVLWNDIDVTGMKAIDILYHDEVAYVGGRSWCIGGIRADENIRLLSCLYSRWDQKHFDEMLEMMEFTKEEYTTKFEELSTGKQMQLQLAFALARHPKLLLLDEPMANLDPVVKTDIWELLIRTIEKENINFDFLLKTLSNTTEMLCSDIEYTIKTNCNKQQTLFINLEIIIQIYENLLSNSIRYAKSMIAIDVNKQEEFLLITVSDDGCGFKSTDIERVTLPFYKPSQDTTSEHLGLGLNICKILCERHGGTIKISNNHKGGACVTACIKIAYVDEK